MIRALSFAALLGLSLPQVGLAQPAVPLRPGTTLFQLDLAGTPVGDAPATIKLLKGNVEVVRQGGVPMLKASTASEFLITLPQVLPADFTLEFDLVPKLGSNPQDLSFEGTPTINQGTASAHVLWHATGSLSVIGGGGDNYETPMPDDLRATLPGVLTRVVLEAQGPTIKLYTNGRRLYTLDKQFARGRVLRVFLGAEDGGTEAVYVARLRISAGGGLGLIAANAGPGAGNRPQPGLPSGSTSYVPPATGSTSQGVTGTTGGSTSTVTMAGGGSPKQVPGGAPATSSQSLASTGGLLPTVVSNVSVTQGTAGPVVNWTPVAVPAGYSVRRWKIDDQACCNNTSAQNLTAPPWQDAALSIAGTYVYEVTATMAGGTASGQAQFTHLKAAGQIALPPPPPPIITTTNPGITAGPITGSGAAPAALTTLAVTVVTAPSTYPGYTQVTWNLAPGVFTITFKRWKSDDPACCNYSGTEGAYTSSWFDPLGANGFPPGTYVYEVTANLASGPLQGRATYTIPATAVLAQPSGTGMVSPVPTTPAAAPTVAQSGVPVLSPQPPPPASITPAPSAPPPVGTYLTGTPAYVRVSWTMPNTAPRGMLYTVERYLESNPTCCRTSVNGLINKAWTDEGTQWPGTYVYRITAVYPDGSTGFIDARWDRPDPVNPTNFRGTPSTGQVILQWDPVPNASWYYLFGPGVPYNPFAITPPIAQFVVRGLAPGTYTWVVGSYYSSPNAPAPVSTVATAFPTITVTVP